MPGSVLLLASLVAFSDERLKPPAAPRESCIEVRQFRGGDLGGCRAAIDRSLAWMCIEEGRKGKESYDVRFKTDNGSLVKQFSYDKRHVENWGGHTEIFFTSTNPKANPDLKIGLAEQKDATVVVAKTRHCIPAEAARRLKP